MKDQLIFSPLNAWAPTHDRPLIISGPCGAESFEQVHATAAGLAALKRVSIFRAGIWKPRTRPNAFEGVGEIGLEWLKTVKAEFGFLTTVEVANANHVALALKHGVDILWIGARTTVNPFSVQEIADAVRGHDIPVMIKNPIHADLQLWVGAIERLHHAGITKLAAIHRGFYSYKKDIYRNPPLWELPIELKTIFPGLPIICDPSHICGNRELLFSIGQKAMDLNFDGLMIESHNNPAVALSDKQQQLTPNELNVLLDKLAVRHHHADPLAFSNQLQQLRTMVDNADEDLLLTLQARMALINEIGYYKKTNNITVLQLERWLNILETRLSSGNKKALDQEFIGKLFHLIHQESIRIQTEILNQQ